MTLESKGSHSKVLSKGAVAPQLLLGGWVRGKKLMREDVWETVLLFSGMEEQGRSGLPWLAQHA